MKNENYYKQWAEANKEHLKEYRKQWHLKNKEKMQEWYKTYQEIHSDERKEYSKKYYLEHKTEMRQKQNEYNRKHYQENPDEEKKRRKEWRLNTEMGRANSLLQAYNQADKRHNRGKGDLTSKWIVDNIFTKPCAHCGKTGWRIIGCNRLDNSKPHTKDNVEPCCEECNNNLAAAYRQKLKSKTVYQYTLEGELVKIWPSAMECSRNGYSQSAISNCCNGKNKTYKCYQWSFIPL